jgi:hypothetical protein
VIIPRPLFLARSALRYALAYPKSRRKRITLSYHQRMRHSPSSCVRFVKQRENLSPRLPVAPTAPRKLKRSGRCKKKRRSLSSVPATSPIFLTSAAPLTPLNLNIANDRTQHLWTTFSLLSIPWNIIAKLSSDSFVPPGPSLPRHYSIL